MGPLVIAGPRPTVPGRDPPPRCAIRVSPSTPVVMLTGWGQRLLAEDDVPPHVDQILNKPPRLPDLREALSLCGSPMRP